MSFYARFFARGALAQLTRLDLEANRIGDAGLTALAEAIKPAADNASGALASLKSLNLRRNTIGDDGMRARCATQQRHVALVCISEFSVQLFGVWNMCI